jgi:hypothetical protein
MVMSVAEKARDNLLEAISRERAKSNPSKNRLARLQGQLRRIGGEDVPAKNPDAVSVRNLPKPAGMLVGEPKPAGMLVGEPKRSGMLVGEPKRSGMLVGEPKRSGMLVGEPKRSGMLVGEPKRSGMLVGEPKRSGMLVGEPKRSGMLVGEPKRSGMLVGEPKRSGMLVGEPKRSGMLVGASPRSTANAKPKAETTRPGNMIGGTPPGGGTLSKKDADEYAEAFASPDADKMYNLSEKNRRSDMNMLERAFDSIKVAGDRATADRRKRGLSDYDMNEEYYSKKGGSVGATMKKTKKSSTRKRAAQRGFGVETRGN